MNSSSLGLAAGRYHYQRLRGHPAVDCQSVREHVFCVICIAQNGGEGWGKGNNMMHGKAFGINPDIDLPLSELTIIDLVLLQTVNDHYKYRKMPLRTAFSSHPATKALWGIKLLQYKEFILALVLEI